MGEMIYLFASADASPEPNSLQTEYYKKQETQMQGLWGNEGSLVVGLTRVLKRASTYSVLVIIISIVISLVCFFMASHSTDGHQQKQVKLPGQPSETIQETVVADPSKNDQDA